MNFENIEVDGGDDSNFICDINDTNSDSTVYIADLPVNAIDEMFLRQLFCDFSISTDPNSIQINTKEDSYSIAHSYAFIKFSSKDQAISAIKDLNYTKLDNIPMRLILATQENIDAICSHKGCLTISNLEESIEAEQLHDAFSNFGEVIYARIPLKKVKGSVVSQGYGYVQFKNQSEAEQAMEDLKDVSINGQQVKISPYDEKEKFGIEACYTNCYIENLPKYVYQSQLQRLFSEFGTPIKITVFHGKTTNHGFCMMSSHEEARRAVEGLNGRKMGDSILSCSRAKTESERQIYYKKQGEKRRRENHEKVKGRNLYVRNFDEFLTEKKLRDIFSQFGEIESASIMYSSDGESKKFGFVCFKNKIDAQNCVKNSVLSLLNKKQLYVTFALTTEQRQADLKNKSQTMRTAFNNNAQNLDPKMIVRSKINNDASLLMRLRDLSDKQAEWLAKDDYLFAKWSRL